METYSLGFCVSGKDFISSFEKDNFSRYSILEWQVFSFSILSISYHSLLACKVSAEKSNNLTGIFFSVMSHFSLPAFKILFVLHFRKFDSMSQCTLI